MHYFRPKKAIKEIAGIVWRFLATRLRLTSYFFGGRHPEEEFTPKDWRDNLLRPEIYVASPEDVPDGSFRRVPATDNLALPRDMRATVAVTANGEPVDDEAKALMAMQNAEAEKAKHNVQDDYTVVYIPPNFRWRILTFITLLWIIGANCTGFAVAVPLTLGRSFFRLFTPRDVHDGYSFIVGFYLIWVCYLIARAVDKLDRRRKRRSDDDGPRAELGLLVAKRGLLWLAKVGYMAFSLGIVVPILLAIVIDLYIVLPIRFSVNPGMVPRIRIVDQWALGLLYAKIGIYVQRIQPPNRISVGLQHVRFSILYLDVVLRHAVDNAAWLDTTRSNHSDEGTYCASSWRTVRDDNYSRSCIQSSVVLFPPNHAGQPVHL
jgi:E3 ubiquitin-protein ligase MARCH6